MNIVKIQQDLIKDCLNNKASDWFIFSYKSAIALLNKCQVFIFPDRNFLLQESKLKAAGVHSSDTFKNVIEQEVHAEPARKTGISKEFHGKDCMELNKLGSNESIYVNKQLLRYYDKNMSFKVINSKSPVFVYEKDSLVGIVLPVVSN